MKRNPAAKQKRNRKPREARVHQAMKYVYPPLLAGAFALALTMFDDEPTSAWHAYARWFLLAGVLFLTPVAVASFVGRVRTRLSDYLFLRHTHRIGYYSLFLGISAYIAHWNVIAAIVTTAVLTFGMVGILRTIPAT